MPPCGLPLDLNDARSIAQFAILPFKIEGNAAIFDPDDVYANAQKIRSIIDECGCAAEAIVLKRRNEIERVAMLLLRDSMLTHKQVCGLVKGDECDQMII
ncbi:MAG: hypothetical protein C0478_08575 [Planctomyces sp.]|nr:hypothetical protein [Planctomyces sp.]